MTLTFHQALRENTIKNVLIVLVSALLYESIFLSLRDIDTDKFSDFLLIISVLLVSVCFANFSFSYEYTKVNNSKMKALSHVATFIFLLLIALLLEALVLSVGFVYPSLHFITLIFSILLYIGVALYDFWDFFRVFNRHQ